MAIGNLNKEIIVSTSIPSTAASSQGCEPVIDPSFQIIVVTIHDRRKALGPYGNKRAQEVLARCRVRTMQDDREQLFFRCRADAPAVPDTVPAQDCGYSIRFGSVSECVLEEVLSDPDFITGFTQGELDELLAEMQVRPRALEDRDFSYLHYDDQAELLHALAYDDATADEPFQDDPFYAAAEDCRDVLHERRSIDSEYLESSQRMIETLLAQFALAPAVAPPIVPHVHPLWLPHGDDRFSLDELATAPPAHEFIIPRYAPKGVVTAVIGAGGTSKTGLAVQFEMTINTGGTLFGDRYFPGATLHLSAEDDRQTIMRHVYTNAQRLDARERRMVSENFHIKNLVGSGVLLTRNISGTIDISPDVESIIAYAKTIKNLRLVVADTLSRLHGGDEDNPGLAALVRAGERIAQATGTAFMILHHSGKVQARAGANDQYSSRGGTALSDNSRSVINLTALAPGKDEIPANGEKLAEDDALIRISHVKSNYGPKVGDRFAERVHTDQQALLREFVPQWENNGIAARWQMLSGWFSTSTDVPHPTARTIDALDDTWGSRRERRDALTYAKDRGYLLERAHPNPSGQRKTYLVLADEAAPEPATAAVAEANAFWKDVEANSIAPSRHQVADSFGDMEGTTGK